MKAATVLVSLNIDVENGSVEEVQGLIDKINDLLLNNSTEHNNAQIFVNNIDRSDINVFDFSDDI